MVPCSSARRPPLSAQPESALRTYALNRLAAAVGGRGSGRPREAVAWSVPYVSLRGVTRLLFLFPHSRAVEDDAEPQQTLGIQSKTSQTNVRPSTSERLHTRVYLHSSPGPAISTSSLVITLSRHHPTPRHHRLPVRPASGNDGSHRDLSLPAQESARPCQQPAVPASGPSQGPSDRPSFLHRRSSHERGQTFTKSLPLRPRRRRKRNRPAHERLAVTTRTAA